MPTPKQVRYHYARIARLRSRLASALVDAYSVDVIVYEDHETESPCAALYEVWRRIKKSTEKQLAQAMREEIKTESDWE